MVRDTSVTALKELYQMETFCTSRMTAPGAAAGGLSWLRAAGSSSLGWAPVTCPQNWPRPGSVQSNVIFKMNDVMAFSAFIWPSSGPRSRSSQIGYRTVQRIRGYDLIFSQVGQ